MRRCLRQREAGLRRKGNIRGRLDVVGVGSNQVGTLDGVGERRVFLLNVTTSYRTHHCWACRSY